MSQHCFPVQLLHKGRNTMRLHRRPATLTSASQDVWELLEPAVPDCLVHLGDNHYQASWWKPVPTGDIEILQRNERIRILNGPYEPKNLSGGLALDFQILTQSFIHRPRTRVAWTAQGRTAQPMN